VDLAIACLPDAFPGFHRQRIYVDSDALAVRRGHPAGPQLGNLKAFQEARHIAVIGPEAQEDMIDAWLRGHGVERRIALAVPSYLQALRTAARTDLVAFVPRRLIAALAGPLNLRRVDPPLDPGIDEQFMFHPTRAQVDPASIWLRAMVKDIVRDLDRRRMPAIRRPRT
jgi:DNA-binding transcriptional LysR family regulator